MAGLPRRHVDQHDTAHLTRGPEWAIPKRAVPAWAHVVPCQATHLATTTFGLWMLGHTCELFAKLSLLRDQIEKIASRERIGKKQYPEHVGRRHMSPAMLSPHGITTTVLICVSIVRTRQKKQHAIARTCARYTDSAKMCHQIARRALLAQTRPKNHDATVHEYCATVHEYYRFSA